MNIAGGQLKGKIYAMAQFFKLFCRGQFLTASFLRRRA